MNIFAFETWVWLVAYSLGQLAVHELAHVWALRFFGKRPDRFGFKLNYWVFPAFYVRMNDTHLLTQQEKIVVHSAGLFVNGVCGVLMIGMVGILNWGSAAMFAVA